MNPMICFSACSMFYCLMLIFVSKNQKTKNYNETKYFKLLLYVNCASLTLEVLGFFLGNRYDELKLINDIVFRLMLLLHIIWSTIMLLYVMSISGDIVKIKIKKVLILIMIICGFISIILPMHCNIKNGVVMNTYGIAVNFVYYYCFIMMLLYVISLLKNIKKKNITSYSPIFLYIIGGTIVSMIQSNFPELVLSNSVDTFVIFSIYFTIQKAMTGK